MLPDPDLVRRLTYSSAMCDRLDVLSLHLLGHHSNWHINGLCDATGGLVEIPDSSVTCLLSHLGNHWIFWMNALDERSIYR